MCIPPFRRAAAKAGAPIGSETPTTVKRFIATGSGLPIGQLLGRKLRLDNRAPHNLPGNVPPAAPGRAGPTPAASPTVMIVVAEPAVEDTLRVRGCPGLWDARRGDRLPGRTPTRLEIWLWSTSSWQRLPLASASPSSSRLGAPPSMPGVSFRPVARSAAGSPSSGCSSAQVAGVGEWLSLRAISKVERPGPPIASAFLTKKRQRLDRRPSWAPSAPVIGLVLPGRTTTGRCSGRLAE